MSPLSTKRPYLPRKKSGFAFTSNIEQIAYISSDAPSMIHFTPINKSHNPTLYIAVPKGIKIFNALRRISLNPPQDYTINGKPFSLYRTNMDASSSKYIFIWQAIKQFPVGHNLTGYYWGEWPKGKQTPQPLTIKTVTIPKVKPFKKIPVWLCMPNDFYPAWPDMKSLADMGFNYMDMWTYLNPGEKNWGLQLIRETQRKTKAAGLKDIAWIREWWWHKAKAEDGKSTLIDGSKSDKQLCLSYRGKWFKALIEQGKLLIDKQIYFHSTDPEMYRNGDDICFCSKCKQRFKAYLKQKHPHVGYVDPVTVERHPKQYAAQHLKWNEFKCFSYTEFFTIYRREMEKYMRQQGIKEPFKFMIYSSYHRAFPGMYEFEDYKQSPGYIKTLEDPKMLATTFNFIAPMTYMDVYANYKDYDMLVTWKDTIVLRRLVGENATIAPLLNGGYPYFYAFDCDMNAEMLKYNILETFAGGGRGFGFWGEGPIDAADMKTIAETVKMLAPHEELILTAKPDGEVKVISNNALAKRLISPKGSLILVSEYSRRPLNVKINCPVSKSCKVINLSSGKTIAQITANSPIFTVKLNKERAVMLYIGQ
jgi:hypothetical protein